MTIRPESILQPRESAARPTTGRLRRGLLRDRVVVLVGAAIAALLLSPLLLLALNARDAGWAEIHRVLFRQRSWLLLQHTVLLSVLVTACSAVVGTATAWCVERTALPARRLCTVLLVLPVAMPDFVVGYAWHTIYPAMNGLAAATLVMTLGCYPLVHLPVSAALRRADTDLEDTAHSLGVGRIATFVRVTLPSIRVAVLGGCLLVVLTVISEYGAFEILRFQTFTTEIFTEFQFDPQAAAALSLPLVLLGLLALCGEAMIPKRVQTRSRPSRVRARTRLSWRAAPALLGVTALVTLAVGVPIGTLGYWMAQSQHTTLPAAATLATATWTTLRYSAAGAAFAVLLALPVALLTFRRGSLTRTVIERGTYVTQSLPGVVIALSLVYFATRYAFGLYQTSWLLVGAYAILHFPLALVCVKASVSRAPARLADIGQSLRRGPVTVFLRVTLPLLAPGVLAGFCLVFLTAVTELTATLVLAPIGVQTLATQFWSYQSEVAYGAAAPYALVIVLIAAVPGVLLSLWFDRDDHTMRRRANP